MFNSLRKLFKALNSSGKSWQLSGAIVLALFSGFLPVNSLILFDLLFLALILNVNFGVYLLFSLIFSGIGYLFDPFFESLGYMVLTNEGLNGFFTTLYNSVIFRWSAFNYTLVTGSLIVSSLLAIPAFFILNKLISLYRDQIGQRLNEWKITKWMNLFNKEAQSTSLFRWWGLGVFGGLAAVIIVFMVLLFDPLARMALEKSLSYALKTQVDVKDFSSSLSDLSVQISGIEVADRDKLSHNLVQVGDIAFDLGFSALVEKKVMIDQLQVKAAAFDVKRTKVAESYKGALEEEAQTTESEEKKSGVKETVSPFVLPDVDDILAKEELRSVKEAQRLREDIKMTQNKWEKVSVELKEKNEVAEIQADAKKLESSLKGGDIQKIAAASKEIDALKSKISSLKTKYSNLKKEFNADQKRLQKQIKNLKNLPSQDINRLQKKYSLNSTGGANLIGTLINDKVGNTIKTVLKYYAMIKPYLNDEKAAVSEDIKPPRGEGRWIKYANHSTIPSLLVKEAKVNVKLKTDEINIDIKDLSSNQKLYAKPMILHADARGSEYKHILADLIDDRRQDKAKTDFDIKLEGLKKDSYNIDSIGMKDILADGSLKGHMLDTTISAKSDIKVQQVKLQMPSQKLLNDLLSSVSQFKVDIGVKGELEKPSITVSSDLDKQLSSGLKSMASKASKKFESQLRTGVMKKASGSSEGLSSDLGDTGSLLSSKQDALSGINLDFSSSSNPLKGILPF